MMVMVLGTFFSTNTTSSLISSDENRRVVSSSNAAPSADPKGIINISNGQILSRALLLDPSLLASTKQAISNNHNYDPILLASLEQLLVQANSFLSLRPTSVIEKDETPSSGSKHYFLSLAPYRWPDPTTADSLPYVNHDGRVNPEVHSIPDKRKMDDTIYRVKVLSLAYYFNDNPSYASKAGELLRVWFLNNSTYMKPNMQHAEVERGKNNGTMTGILHGKNLPDVIDAMRLIQNSPSWSERDKYGMELWFSKYLTWLLGSKHGKAERISPTNHGTWYAVQVSSIALFLNRTDIAKSHVIEVQRNLLPQQIEADGSQPYELRRVNSLDYSIFNLLGHFRLASIGQHLGIDLWNYKTQEGAGLQKALDYLLPNIMNKQSWPHSQTKQINIKNLVDMLCRAATYYKNNESYVDACKYVSEQDISIADTFPP